MSKLTRKERKIQQRQQVVNITVPRGKKQRRYVLPFVKKADNFTPTQIKPILRKTIVFGAFVSLAILTTIAFIVFVVLTVGINMILTDNRQMVTFIAFVLWIAVVSFVLLSYWKIGEIYRLVRKYRKQSRKKHQTELDRTQEQYKTGFINNSSQGTTTQHSDNMEDSTDEEESPANAM